MTKNNCTFIYKIIVHLTCISVPIMAHLWLYVCWTSNTAPSRFNPPVGLEFHELFYIFTMIEG